MVQLHIAKKSFEKYVFSHPAPIAAARLLKNADVRKTHTLRETWVRVTATHKLNAKFILEQATKAQRWSRGMALLFH